MDSGEDRFAAFLGWLAAHLDEHETRAERLAAEFYLSRTLLDRLVKAAAGESTARFRRRLLLERAAHSAFAAAGAGDIEDDPLAWFAP